MKRITKLISLVPLIFCLSACDFLSKIVGDNYSGYEEYFEKELNYSKYTDMDSLNAAIGEDSYFWSMNEGTNYTAYYTGKSYLVYVYNDKQRVVTYFTDGTKVNIENKDDVLTFNNDNVTYNATTGQKTVYGNGQEDSLNVAIDNGGYLVVAYQKYMFYVTSDLKNVYVNEKNTNVFQGYSDTKIIPESELLTTTLQALGEDQRIKLPAPGNKYEIWYGMSYYKDHKSHGTAYIADVHPKDYVETLKQNGFTVVRSYEDQFYAFYGEYGGY